MHGEGVCMAKGGMCGIGEMHGEGGQHVWQRGGARYRDTINERAVCILLECILVVSIFLHEPQTVAKFNTCSMSRMYQNIYE